MAIFTPTMFYFGQPVAAAAAAGAIVATGGQISEATIDGVLYKIHTFTSSANFTVTSGGGNVDYLVVAGGGGGGGNNFAASRGGAGGGGAGGAKTGSLSVAAQSYVVKVGLGGAGATANTASPGTNGQTSSFDTISSTGGGGGGSALSRNGIAGGSGGGGPAYVTNGAGGLGTAGEGKNGGSGSNDGGRPSGAGGGGAATAGSNGVGTTGGNGGNGLLVNYTGINTYYAGGGGGSIWQSGQGDITGSGGIGGGGNGTNLVIAPGNGTDGLGGGGGGGSSAVNGGEGGDGIVIVRYASGSAPNIVTSGLILYMDVTNAASYPGTGTNVFNLVAGYPITGSLVNSPTYKDNFLQFNGTNQYFQIPVNSGTNYSLLFTTGSSTVMGATRYADTSGNGRMISVSDIQTSNWLLGHFSNTTLNYYAEGAVAGTPGGPNDTNWRVYAGTANVPGDSYNFYVNGALNTGPSTNGARGPAGFEVGVSNNNGTRTEWSSGSLAFIMLYNRVLTAAEITQNYDALKSKVGLT